MPLWTTSRTHVTRVRARLPTARLFFCCHKCHTRSKFEWKNLLFFRQWRRETKPFSGSYSVYVRHLNHAFVKTRPNKYCIKLKYSGLPHSLWHLWQQKCKNSWQERARTRARKGIYRYFHNSNVPFPISISGRRISRLLPLYWKQHVIFNKTTRRFQQNNTSFPTKQHDVFDKTNRWLRGSGTRFRTMPSSDNVQQTEGNRKNCKKQNTLDLTSWNCQNQG